MHNNYVKNNYYQGIYGIWCLDGARKWVNYMKQEGN